MKLLIYPDVDLWTYSVKALAERQDVKCFPLNPHCTKLQLIIRKAFVNANLPPQFILGSKLRSAIKFLSSGDVIIIADYSDLCLFYAIQKIAPVNVRLAYWIWNPIKGSFIDEFQHKLSIIKALGYKTHTFNPVDAERFGLILDKQFYPIKYYSKLPVIENKYDCYFAGFVKDRKRLIDSTKALLSKFNTKFIVAEKGSDCVSFDENINNVRSSKCLVEIVQNGQTGMTLRPLEALTFKKKLITSNAAIISESIYTPDNIFVIGYSDESELKDFISSPYVDVELSKYQCYDINEWINLF